jgi:hypothetical protein
MRTASPLVSRSLLSRSYLHASANPTSHIWPPGKFLSKSPRRQADKVRLSGVHERSTRPRTPTSGNPQIILAVEQPPPSCANFLGTRSCSLVFHFRVGWNRVSDRCRESLLSVAEFLTVPDDGGMVIYVKMRTPLRVVKFLLRTSVDDRLSEAFGEPGFPVVTLCFVVTTPARPMGFSRGVGIQRDRCRLGSVPKSRSQSRIRRPVPPARRKRRPSARHCAAGRQTAFPARATSRERPRWE